MSGQDFTPTDKLVEMQAIICIHVQTAKRHARKTGKPTTEFHLRRISVLKAIARDLQDQIVAEQGEAAA